MNSHNNALVCVVIMVHLLLMICNVIKDFSRQGDIQGKCLHYHVIYTTLQHFLTCYRWKIWWPVPEHSTLFFLLPNGVWQCNWLGFKIAWDEALADNSGLNFQSSGGARAVPSVTASGWKVCLLVLSRSNTKYEVYGGKRFGLIRTQISILADVAYDIACKYTRTLQNI